MTVKIGQLSANFTNPTIVYTAIGMNVTDEGSAASSKLLNLSVNNESKFIVFKSGETHIRSNFSPSSSNTIFNINNGANNLVSINPRTAQLNVDSKSNSHIFVKSYSEAALDVGTSLVFDLGKASVFICSPSVFNDATFIKPNTAFSADTKQSYSCTVIVRYAQTADASVWSGTDVVWPAGRYPNPAGNVAVYNFFNTGSTNYWYGTFGGENYML